MGDILCNLQVMKLHKQIDKRRLWLMGWPLVGMFTSRSPDPMQEPRLGHLTPTGGRLEKKPT